MSTTSASIGTKPLVPDLLFGAEAIAGALGLTRRQVYHAVSSSHLPSFRIGGTVCARRSTLMRWFEEQEGDPVGLTSDREQTSDRTV